MLDSFEQRAKNVERLAGDRLERLGIHRGAPVDLGAGAGRAEDEVGVEPDHRIAAALRAALDRFEQEHGAAPPCGELQVGRYRGLQVGDQRRDADRRAASLVEALKRLEGGLDGAHLQLPSAACSVR